VTSDDVVTDTTVIYSVDYEMQTYTRGLDFERPPLTFQASQWEKLACDRLSADSKGVRVPDVQTYMGEVLMLQSLVCVRVCRRS
jgi:hypothetical protein